jgi:hypothetical protein
MGLLPDPGSDHLQRAEPALFVVIELEVDDPLLDLRVFRYGAFTHSLLLIASLSVVLFAVVFYVPQFLQRGQGLGALDTVILTMHANAASACNNVVQRTAGSPYAPRS